MENWKENNATHNDLLEINNLFYDGLNSMFKGDVEPLNKIWSHGDFITYSGPFGGTLKGWENVGKDFSDVASMKLGGKISPSEVHAYVNGSVGYVSCIEVGENVDHNGQIIKVGHRATNIFQLENGTWRLIHHHTDISTQLQSGFDKSIN